jgi:hypothetical protein
VGAAAGGADEVIGIRATATASRGGSQDFCVVINLHDKARFEQLGYPVDRARLTDMIKR